MDNFKFMCSICDATFDEETYMKHHLTLHKKTIPSDVSEKPPKKLKLQRNDDAEAKKVLCYYKEEENFICFFCKRPYLGNSHKFCLMKIENLNKPETKTEKEHKIPDEVKIQDSSLTINYDANETVSQDRNLQKCKVCKLVTKTPIDQHMRMMHKDKPFICVICVRGFGDENSLQHHLRFHQDLTCQICKKKFAYSKHLKNHMSTHEINRFYFCKFCKKKFAQETQLKSHIIIFTQTQGKPYKCEVCEKYFYSQCQLINHKRDIHFDKNPFSCHYCKIKFSEEKDLLIHINVHYIYTHGNASLIEVRKLFAQSLVVD